jgi:hypothetical protein
MSEPTQSDEPSPPRIARVARRDDGPLDGVEFELDILPNPETSMIPSNFVIINGWLFK